MQGKVLLTQYETALQEGNLSNTFFTLKTSNRATSPFLRGVCFSRIYFPLPPFLLLNEIPRIYLGFEPPGVVDTMSDDSAIEDVIVCFSSKTLGCMTPPPIHDGHQRQS